MKNLLHANSVFAFFVFFGHFCSQLFPLMLPWLFKNETYRYFTSFHFWAPGLHRFGEGGGPWQKEKQKKVQRKRNALHLDGWSLLAHGEEAVEEVAEGAAFGNGTD